RAYSILDLLGRFLEEQYQANGVSRLSDLHLKVGEPARFRFDNELVAMPEAAPISPKVMEGLLFPLLNEDQIASLGDSASGDVDAAFEWEERKTSFRLNVFRDREGLACAIRVLPREVPTIDKIGFPSDRTWKELVDLRQGLVIVTGITGSGKSTTVASLLHYINQHRQVRIITLEDPIEYVLDSNTALISQREVGRHISSFEQGLRSALREDPDVIFVGEMRDRETTSLALTAGETGHLIFSTLHTKDTKGAITRITDLFPTDRTKELCSQISFSLTYVLGQKLVPRAEGGGRRVAMEVLKVVPAVANLIRNGNWHQIYSALETHSKDGMNTLEGHLAELVKSGEILQDDAIRSANNESIFTRLG
ncbi:MAG: PilT/PilU family type 4a pilus ATPase, partial [Planctomycetota bacterium]